MFILFLIICAALPAKINRGPQDFVYIGGALAGHWMHGWCKSLLPDLNISGTRCSKFGGNWLVYAGGTGRVGKSEKISCGLQIVASGPAETVGHLEYKSVQDSSFLQYTIHACVGVGAGIALGIVHKSYDVVRLYAGVERRPFSVSTLLGGFSNKAELDTFAWRGMVTFRHKLPCRFPMSIVLGYTVMGYRKPYKLTKGLMDITLGVRSNLPLGGVQVFAVDQSLFLGLEYSF